MDVNNILADTVAATINRVSVRTSLTPEIGITPSVNKDTGETSDGLLRLLAPRIEIATVGGTAIIAPWGEPRYNLFPLVALGCVAILSLAAFGMYALARG